MQQVVIFGQTACIHSAVKIAETYWDLLSVINWKIFRVYSSMATSTYYGPWLPWRSPQQKKTIFLREAVVDEVIGVDGKRIRYCADALRKCRWRNIGMVGTEIV